MTEILIVKTGALGDVLRTTSILPGLAARYDRARVTWLTAPAAVDLVRGHPLVHEVVAVSPKDAAAVDAAARELALRPFDRVLSLDDEEPLCRLATAVVGGVADDGRLSGAYLDASAARRYTPDVGPWFDMGLLSVHGKERADALKLENARSHAAIYADMFGLALGEPELPLHDDAVERAAAFAARAGLDPARRYVGLNTGSGGRWESKKLPEDRTVQFARELAAARDDLGFLLLGGPEERDRNRRLADALSDVPGFVDAGVDHALLDFAALVDRLALLVTSDSLALHVAVARKVPVLCFFAPTSAAEIELYGRGRKVLSTAPDYGSYRKDADVSTLTVERLLAPALELLDA